VPVAEDVGLNGYLVAHDAFSRVAAVVHGRGRVLDDDPLRWRLGRAGAAPLRRGRLYLCAHAVKGWGAVDRVLTAGSERTGSSRSEKYPSSRWVNTEACVSWQVRRDGDVGSA